ncbi:fatty acid desaturase [Mesorhizobium sp. YR577]|uniref:fatty acid desaturase n=1 Tax=Mesorhizobium sp. YR577 TaxID=1884373 RepID=UPI0008EF56CE|nr:fatty acid desaturase [Mesorhizobium sp. YR577]SFT76718.1 Fatty acid desaturase [Mesorhizobium sp. YR577]
MAYKKSIRRNGTPAVEWPTIVLITATYGSWAGACFFLWPSYPVLALLVLALILAMQSSLMHEASHGHPTRKSWLNELLVGLPIGLVYPFRRFKSLHLRHHADESLTDPFDDPESYYQSFWKHEELPRWLKTLLSINNTMVGRFVLGPALGTIGFLLEEARLIADGDRAVRKAWLLHAAGLAVVLPLVTEVFGIPLWLYVLVPVWLGQSFISVRTFAEHQWSERPDGRTIIIERSPFAFLFLNNNLHLVHHKSPTIPWYRLPKLFRERRDEWIAMNKGYVFPNYLALLREYAFRAKEPVVHPALRRAPEAGRAFQPRVRGRSVNGLGTIPVPAEPPKE